MTIDTRWKWAAAWMATLPSVWAVAQLGRLHPDEVYQYLEPAYFSVHGYGIRAWEWQQGLRNWILPGTLAALLRLCSAFGVDHPIAYRAVLALPLVVLQFLSLLAVHRYSARRVSPTAAWAATALYALYGTALLFHGRTLGESFAGLFLILALERLDAPESKSAGVTAGVWLGMSVVARYPSGLFVLGALAWLLWRKERTRFQFVCLGGAAIALLLGIVDAVTWGAPFHSFWKYFQFNVLSDGAARSFGAEPAQVYLLPLLTLLPLWTFPGLGFSLRREKMGAAWAMTLPYLAALLLTPHKEARFLYPACVLWVVHAAPHWTLALWNAVSGRAARIALTAASATLGFFTFLAFPMDLRGDQFRAIVKATRPAEVTGLLIVNEGLWGSGGNFFIGKNIPWLNCDTPDDSNFRAAMRDSRFNRAVTFEGRAIDALQSHGFEIEATVGRETILVRRGAH